MSSVSGAGEAGSLIEGVGEGGLPEAERSFVRTDAAGDDERERRKRGAATEASLSKAIVSVMN